LPAPGAKLKRHAERNADGYARLEIDDLFIFGVLTPDLAAAADAEPQLLNGLVPDCLGDLPRLQATVHHRAAADLRQNADLGAVWR
jgi:hypothetical protein